MNIFMSMEPAVKEMPNSQASDTQAPLPEQGSAFDLMLSQLMQAVISLPVHPQLPAADQSVPTGEGMATTLPTEGAAGEAVLTPSQAAIEKIQTSFVATINDLFTGAASSQGDAISGNDEPVQAGEDMAAMLPSDGAAGETVSTPSQAAIEKIQTAFVATINNLFTGAGQESAPMLPLTSLQQIQAVFAAIKEDLQDDDATEGQILSLPVSGQADSALAEGNAQALIAKPDSREAKSFSQKSAEPVQTHADAVQLPADALKMASKVEEQHPLIMRESILAEDFSEDMIHLPESQSRIEKTSIPETLPVNSHAGAGMMRYQAEPASSPAAANAQHSPETMHVEGNRFVITRLDSTSLRISLQPEELGRLDIGLMLDKGVVTAQIQASSAAGKELLEKHMHDILSALAQEGISIGGFSVSLKDDRNELSWSQNQHQGHQIQGESVTTNEFTSAPRQRMNQGAVSIFV